MGLYAIVKEILYIDLAKVMWGMGGCGEKLAE